MHVDTEREQIGANRLPFNLTRDGNCFRKSAVSFPFHGKLEPIRQSDVIGLVDCLKPHIPIDSMRPIIIGLTESGIVPSFAMHLACQAAELRSRWICSTRDAAGSLEVFESHSHAPLHHLPAVPSSDTVILVEDEITTGKTLMGLGIALARAAGIRQLTVLTFLDQRSEKQQLDCDRQLRSAGVKLDCRVVAWPSEKNTRIHPVNAYTREMKWVTSFGDDDFHYASRRPFLTPQHAIDVPHDLPITSSLLAIGESIDIALRVLLADRRFRLRHMTLSPWKVDGKSVRTRLNVGRHFVYNWAVQVDPICVIVDPHIRESLPNLAKILGCPIEYWPG